MDKRASQSIVDYISRNQSYVDAWEGREKAVIGGVAVEKSDDQLAVDGLHRMVEWALRKSRHIEWSMQLHLCQRIAPDFGNALDQYDGNFATPTFYTLLPTFAAMTARSLSWPSLITWLAGRELTFSQADMWFFLWKIVHDMYKE
ncbi:hypothetical protein MRB53_023632 [Persea americana]|uniref:Uncharacterized protein n=1 Tax=Persea americana TaxID=3435 RepID=A0ACC2L9Z9_PERAE|nr:hypothetical protein MRB53_023632 [Persea americana]